MQLKALLSMTRPGNSIMAAVGIIIGMLFSRSIQIDTTILLVIAGTTALGFGNVINDIFDIDTDRIAHPNRALVSGKVTLTQSKIFAVSLALISVLSGFLVSPLHGIATTIPLILLSVYAWKLKATPLLGNILVSALVSYTLIFGALSGNVSIVIIPAILAFITNLIREIVKDLADEEGDRIAGIFTTAMLNRVWVNRGIMILTLLSIVAAPLPIFFSTYQVIYPWIIILLLFPLQIRGFVLARTENRTAQAKNLKFQLLAGLLAVACEGVRFFLLSK